MDDSVIKSSFMIDGDFFLSKVKPPTTPLLHSVSCLSLWLTRC